jgi:hypothetical protein
VKVSFKEKDARVLPDMSAKVAFLSRAPEGRRAQARDRGAPEAVAKRGEQRSLYVVGDKTS